MKSIKYIQERKEIVDMYVTTLQDQINRDVLVRISGELLIKHLGELDILDECLMFDGTEDRKNLLLSRCAFYLSVCNATEEYLSKNYIRCRASLNMVNELLD